MCTLENEGTMLWGISLQNERIYSVPELDLSAPSLSPVQNLSGYCLLFGSLVGFFPLFLVLIWNFIQDVRSQCSVIYYTLSLLIMDFVMKFICL